MPRPPRADALRNRAAIFNAALKVLAKDASASMREIIKESGVPRSAAYRHFPGREQLLQALLSETIERAVAITAEAAKKPVSGTSVLEGLIRDFVSEGERYSVVYLQRRSLPLVRRGEQRMAALMHELILAHHAAGVLDPSVPIEWVEQLLRTMPLSAIEAFNQLGVPADRAADLAAETFRRAVAKKA